jgi:nucleotide-binding universal stress UspA family protein
VNGHPGVALVDFARGARADLIAVGTHGAGFFSRLVIGSVTTYLLRSAPCSILAVPGARTASPRRR